MPSRLLPALFAGLAALLLCLSWPARAEEPTIEFVRGASVTTGRVLGMGGVAVGVGEGARSQLYNPAASARRRPPAWGRPFDSDSTLALVNNPFTARDNGPANLAEEGPPETTARPTSLKRARPTGWSRPAARSWANPTPPSTTISPSARSRRW